MKIWKKISVSAMLLLVLGIFSCEDPNAPTGEFTVTVSGQVVRLNTTGLDSVVLTLSNPFRRDTVKSDGSFNYSFTSSEKNDVTTEIRFRHINLSYIDTTIAVVYGPNKKAISLGEVRMKGVSSAQDSIITGKPSSRAKVIKFVSSSAQIIAIRGAGNDIANIVFEVRDSLGVPVDEANKVNVSFTILSKPDNEVVLNRSNAFTNSIGQVVVQLSSGQKAGQAQVQATTTVKNLNDTTQVDTIKSDIVTVVIAGGLPVYSRFTIGADKRNIPGLVKFGLRNVITAIVGDTFGNPVQKGTLISFTTTGGIIQKSAATSDDGILSVDLISGLPYPPNGRAIITAQVGTPGANNAGAVTKTGTFDEAVIIKGLKNKKQVTTQAQTRTSRTNFSTATTFSKNVSVLFTGAPRIYTADSSFVVKTSGTKTIEFTVDDINGNPLSEGTSVKISGIGLDTTGAVLTGDVENVLPDTDDPSYTKFRVSIADKRTKNLNSNVNINLTVEVSGENGNLKKSYSGVLESAVSDSGKIGSIAITSTATDSIVASGAGSPNSVLIQARVLNVNNQPSPGVPVSFAIVRSVDGGEHLSTLTTTTNASGLASTTLYSGIRSGLVQVQASVKKDTLSIATDPKNVYIKTGKVTTLSLVSAATNVLSVKGGGGEESTVLVFEGKDSLGNTIDAANQVNVTFSLQGDTAGARINPSTMNTDPNTGRVTASLSSGSQAGIILVTATAGSVTSAAVQISVSGGLPVQSQFTLSLPKKNYSILTDKQTVATITAGDAFGNPAKAGTLISFKTNGGIIDAAAATSQQGGATANLQIVNPQPPGGIATIEAKTFGANGVTVRDTQTVVFSREAIITDINGPYDNFTIPDGGTGLFRFNVADINGNPIAQGNTITVEAYGPGAANILLSGDINRAIPDAKVSGTGTTQFSFTARDTLSDEGQGVKSLGFTIRVNGPNTTGAISKSYDGQLSGGVGVGNEGNVASVRYIRSSNDTIFVANAGIPTRDTITFRVRSINEQPVKNAAVQFSLTQALNASEFLSPSYAISNDSGEVKVVVHSGVKAGVLKVEARVTAGNSSIASTSIPVYIKTGGISSIALISVERTEISVRGVGGTENTNVTYEARDVLGNPIDFANQTMMYFRIKGLPNNNIRVRPDSALTDPFSGRVTVNVTSDSVATVLQVVAQNQDSTVKSSPVPIIVHGGFAVDSLFLFNNVKQNISIYDGPQLLELQLGDRYGNPVKPGSAVYFGTNAGIVTASSFTDNIGKVSASFTPVANTNYQGLRTITASTVGQNAALIQKSISVLMTGKPTINVTNLATDTVNLFDGSSQLINFEVADNLGNPISGGHTYDIDVEGEVGSEIYVSGDVLGTTIDTQDKVSGTKYSFTVGDALTSSGNGGSFKIKIIITGITGTTVKTLVGKLLAPANIIVPPSARQPASIALIGSSTTDISISGVGGTENATITYEVRDSVGAPITTDNRATVNFNINFYPNSYSIGGTPPSILPVIDSTDDNGRVRVSIISGTQAGAVQIEAVMNLTNPVRTISSQPVRISVNSGFADQTHFTLSPTQYNFPGLEKAFLNMGVTVQVADKFSNPVKEGTVVYFNSANGAIQTQTALTDRNGFVTMALYSGNPYPLSPNLASGLSNGYSRIYARTIGRDSALVRDSVEILWTGKPIITKTDTINTFTIANAGSAGPFTFTVQDYLNHPMSSGTSIIVEANGLVVNGNANVTMPDTKSTGAGITSFTFTVTDENTVDSDDPFASLITVVVTHPVYGTYKRVIASGTVD